MKKLLMIAVFAVSPAFAQAPTDKPAAPAAAPAAAPKAAEKAQTTAKAAHKPNPKRSEDARHCLDEKGNTEIIKCAEAYL